MGPVHRAGVSYSTRRRGEYLAFAGPGLLPHNLLRLDAALDRSAPRARAAVAQTAARRPAPARGAPAVARVRKASMLTLWAKEGTEDRMETDEQMETDRLFDREPSSGSSEMEVPLAPKSTADYLKMAFLPNIWPERFKVVFMCFLSFIICNLDRINVSVAIIPMAKYYGWSQSTVGIIQSSFFWGYVLTQIPGGYYAHKLGGKVVLGTGVVAWSMMTLLTPAAASSPIYILLAARVLLGIGEGVAMPSMNSMVTQWVPPQERSRSLSLIYSGMYMGSVVGLLLCPKFITEFGWQSVFYSFGSVGIVWAAIFAFAIGQSPEETPGITDRELRHIYQGRTSEKKDAEYDDIPWKLFLTNPAVLAICCTHFCVTWGYFVLLTWMPTYFNSALGFDLSSSSILSVLPWLAMFAFANVGGFIADKLIENGQPITRVRKGMQTVGFLGPSIMLTGICFTNSAQVAVVLMTAALGLGSFSQSGVYSNHGDIAPEYAGILLGISNTFAAVPGIIGVALTGFILDATGNSWNTVFGIAVGFYLLGTVVFNLFGTGERVF